MQFLPELTEDLSLDKLNTLFATYLEERYHQTIHGTTGQKPIERYLADMKTLRKAPDNLPEYFRKLEVRKVNNDRTIQLNGNLYEAPLGLVGLKVTLRYKETDHIEVFVDEESRGFLKNLNQEVNSRVKRVSVPSTPAVTGGKLFERKAGGN